MNSRLFIGLQHLVPQHALSRAAGWLAETEVPFIKNTFISWFVNRYNVDMSLAAETNPTAYKNFNAFFTRALKSDARPIDSASNSIVCPADGAISQLGDIVDGRIFQAKGQDYSVDELLGDDGIAAEFAGGTFATVYLSPRDYHRVHMPFAGTLRKTISVPGELFSVNTVTAENVPRLFSRNERLVAIFDTEVGPMAVVLVGAMIVAGIETVWDTPTAPFASRTIVKQDHTAKPVHLEKGAEMGRFKLGSTAIVLFARDKMAWSDTYKATTPTRMGEAFGQII